MKRILVTGAGSTLGQGIIKSILKSNQKYHIIAADPSPLSVGLYWAAEKVRIPNANEDHYIQEFSKLLESSKPDVVMVGTDVELPKLSKFKSELEKIGNCQIIVSSPSTIEIANDKYLTAQFLMENGFSFPRSCLPESWETQKPHFTFPLIVKPRDGARSIGVHKVTTENELKNALATTKFAVIQEYIPDDKGEYTAGVICLEGEVLGSIVLKRDLKDGNTYRAYSDSFPELNNQVAQVAKKLNPFGPCNFQFRIGDNGKIKIFEINARFSGTTPIRAAVGFNEVDFILNRLLKNESQVPLTVEKKVILRFWEELVLNPNELVGN